MKTNGYDDNKRFYTGVGSRETPQDVCRKMFTAGKILGEAGFTLRSGGAKGADHAFESGSMAVTQQDANADGPDVQANHDIYLPFKRFNGHSSPLFGSTKEARLIAKEFHPRWDILSCRGRDFHARNAYQVLGSTLDNPSRFLICWTPNGRVTGGTGQALRIAKAYDVPILNFGCHDDEYISNFILEQIRKG